MSTKFIPINNYRNDIDGLRAIAILSVIAFHFGYLTNGFLGVDVFFVISGYLITGIIYKEFKYTHFSIVNFYLKRIRRIIPLSLFIISVSLVIGVITMLPDDLENLAQSVIATNLFSNNILQAITTKDYWNVVNEYKPLMHTWALGIEEQYYLFYPLLFLFIGKKKYTLILPALLILTIASILLYLFSSYQDYEKFYLLPFRFFELSSGGILAIALKNKIFVHKFSYVFVFALIFLLCSKFIFISNELMLIMTVLCTLCILASSNEKDKLTSFILENRLFITIGKISFSMYMWHQVLLSYARYFFFQELNFANYSIIFIINFMLSLLSYKFIEQPFRNKNKINTQILFFVLGVTFFVTTAISFYIYNKSGVLKDIPELNISKSEAKRNMHISYSMRILNYDKPFKSTDKIKVLVIGDSFARDWANVLMESKYNNELEISYIDNFNNNTEQRKRVEASDIVFYTNYFWDYIPKLGINEKKLWIVGTKNFGYSNGIFYNYRGDDYYNQRTSLRKGYLEQNKILNQRWGDKYIDYIAKVIDNNHTVPVFTPSRKFISQDCRHFTMAGAQYFAQLFEKELGNILFKAKSGSN